MMAALSAPQSTVTLLWLLWNNLTWTSLLLSQQRSERAFSLEHNIKKWNAWQNFFGNRDKVVFQVVMKKCSHFTGNGSCCAVSSVTIVGKIFHFKISVSCVLYSVVILLLDIDFVISALPQVNTGKVFCYIQLTGLHWLQPQQSLIRCGNSFL